MNSKRKLKKEDPTLIKAFSILPEYLVDVLVKEKRKIVIINVLKVMENVFDVLKLSEMYFSLLY